MTTAAQILVVDDEANIRLTLTALLRRAGYTVDSAESGAAAISILERRPFDMLVVDLKMPEIGGMEVVAAARRAQPDLAIIVLTGHGTLESAIDGLHQGVFDYILKTSDPSHVVERVEAGLLHRAQTRRHQGLLELISSAAQELAGASSETPNGENARQVTVGGLRLDTWRQAALLNGRTLTLTPTEFRLLLYLGENAGAMVGYTALVRAALGHTTTEQEASELIKPHIHHLRSKLEPEPTKPRYVLNVRGKGYLLNPLPEE